MTQPMRVYRHGDNLIPTSITASSEIVSGEASPANHHPGKSLVLGTSFQIVANLTDQIVINANGGAVTYNLTEGTYSADDLETHLEALGIEGSNPGQVLNFSVTYNDTTRKFNILGTTAFEILWASGGYRCQNLATKMGYSNAADDTGGMNYSSDSAVYCKDKQYAVWNVSTAGTSGTGVDVEAIMVYATNLTADEKITVYADYNNLGQLEGDWAGATLVGETKLGTESATNDLYAWLTDVSLIRYVAIFVDRDLTVAQLVIEPLELGVVAVWDGANFDADDYGRNITSAFESRRVVLDDVQTSYAGGNLEIGVVRGYIELLASMTGWDTTSYKALGTYLDRYRVDPALWMMDPDTAYDSAARLAVSYTPESTIFGYVPPDGWSAVRWRGPNHVRDLTLLIRGVRMQPEV
jgi:hypothetical protein